MICTKYSWQLQYVAMQVTTIFIDTKSCFYEDTYSFECYSYIFQVMYEISSQTGFLELELVAK